MTFSNAASGRRTLRRHLLILGFYLLLAVILTYPLVLKFTTHVPGSDTWAYDEYTFIWNLWHFKASLIEGLVSPLHTELIYYPLGIDLILFTFNFFNALVALPLQMVFSLPMASNLTLMLSTVLSAYGTYLLVRYLLREERAEFREGAAVLAGLVYAFASNRAIYAAMGHYDMVTSQWIPFYALYLVKMVREPHWKNAVLAGLFAAFALLAEMIFGVFLGMLTLIYLLVAARGTARSLIRLGGRFLVLAITAMVIWSPVGLPILRELLTGGYELEGWGEGINLSVDMFGFITPTALHPIWGSDWVRELRAVIEGTARFSDINTVFLGFLTLALALIGWLRFRRKVTVWVWSALTFAILSLGPILQINGRSRFDLDGLDVTYPLPFAILHYIPIVRGNRVPNRFSAVLMLALAVLVAYGVVALARIVARRIKSPRGALSGLYALLAVLLIFEHAAFPMPLTDARVPSVYEQLAQEEGDFAILQLPLGWRNSFGMLGAENTRIQYYQTQHGKPILGGNISRNPPFKMDYFERLPFFRAIVQTETYREPDPETDTAARAQAAELMSLYNVRYVVMLPPVAGRVPYADTWERTQAYARDLLPLESEPAYQAEGVTVYRVVQPPLADTVRVDFGHEEAFPYQGEGWDSPEEIFGVSATWATATTARIFLRLQEEKTYRLTLRAAPFTYPGNPQQSLQAELNGHSLGPPLLMHEGYGEYRFDAPAAVVKAGLNTLTLHFGNVARPRDVVPSSAAIGTTGVDAPLDIEMDAALDHAYIALFDEANRKTDASAGRRGYNVAVLDPASGRLLDKRGFDTWANEYEVASLAAFVEAIPPSRIVVVATYDAAGRFLTEAARQALSSLGADLALLPGEQGAHVLIGVKGAVPGSALEMHGPEGAYLRLGRNPDRRTLTVAVDWLLAEAQ